MAVAEQFLLAEMALPAGDVEGDEHVIALLQILDAGADLLDDAAEFVAEGHADARVGHHAVIEVRSDPQMQERVTRRIASSGCSIFGSGLSSTRTR
jgi:hypothetical protein